MVSTFVPAIFTVILSFTFPTKAFQWEKFQEIELIDDKSSQNSSLGLDEQEKVSNDSHASYEFSKDLESPTKPEKLTPTYDQEKYMRKMSIFSGAAGAFAFLIVWIIWPFSMYGTRFEFGPKFLSGWLVVSVIWVFLGLLVILLLPPFDGRRQITTIIKGVSGR